jgi:hypothetical protein
MSATFYLTMFVRISVIFDRKNHYDGSKYSKVLDTNAECKLQKLKIEGHNISAIGFSFSN